MPIIDPNDLDPIEAAPTGGGKIITPDMLDPVPPSIPAQIGRGLIEQLPMAGMVLGGVGGAALAPVVGAPIGAGLGAGVGQAAKGFLQETLGIRPPQLPSQNIGEIGKQTALGATTEVLNPYIAKGIQKVVSPFANLVGSRMAEDPTIQAAQNLVTKGAPISPDVIAGTKTSNFFNWLAEKVWPASAVMAKERGSLQDVANGLQQEFVQSRGLYNTSKGGVDQAWENWVNLAGGKEAPYELPQTAEALKKAMSQPFAMELKLGKDEAGNLVKESVPAGAFWKKYASTFLNELETTGQTSVQSIRDLLSTIKPTASKGAERTAKMKIVDTLVNELGEQSSPEAAEALASARDIARLQRIAGPLQSIFNKSVIEPTSAGEEAIFNPASFVNLWNQRRGSFLNNNNYSAEDIRVIDKFTDQMKALVPDLSRAAKYKPSLSLQGITQIGLDNPLAVAGTIYKFPAVAVPVGMDTMMAHSLMSPNGIMRKFLTTGFNPPNLTTKMGIMKGLQEATQ